MGIETSCDDTGVAIVDAKANVLVNVLSSQRESHARYGGVVPELASREHTKALLPLVDVALSEVDKNLGEIDLIAVTRGPGLIGSLLVGLMGAKGMCWGGNIPLVGVNHLAAHIWAAALDSGGSDLPTPSVALVVSGGHTELLYLDDHYQGRLLGQTRDDAAGEAFDKVARLLGLGYPGGPEIDRLAAGYCGDLVAFPRPMLDGRSLDFSFSGLKTAVAVYLEKLGGKVLDSQANTKRIAASFQAAVVDVLLAKTQQALMTTGAEQLIVSGGVAANRGLREALQSMAVKQKIGLFIPPPVYCTDNAAMIAVAGYRRFREQGADPLTVDVDPGLYLPTLKGGGISL